MKESSTSSRISEATEPQITSFDPEERILARRIRIQKRNAAKKRLQIIEDRNDISSDEENTVLEEQVEKSKVELLTLTQEGKELITNVRVAADGHEVNRRSEQAVAREARLHRLEDEASIAQQKFNIINAKWESIVVLNDPLDLHHETELQREKCVDLLAQKDQLIEELKSELAAGDVRFLKDQQRQAEDITLLVERIDNQIAVMRRAYRQELALIEQAIDIVRKSLMEANNKQWEALYQQREEEEIYNLEQRFVALAEHNQLMQDILVHHQEKFRATKISLEKDIQVLQQQLEQVKAICLLNKEKMEYNYQVLKKREEESLLIRSQQKRRINKLQDIVTKLKCKILAMEKSTQAEVKRLTSEVIKLHRNIKDIRLKADHFCTVNETKYFQLWKFNHDVAQKFLDKILSIDQLVHEQQLGIPWKPVSYCVITKSDLPSHKTATAAKQSLLPRDKGIKDSEQDVTDRVLKCILEAVADRSGFLVEERLNILLAPYTHSQRTLVRIDNVFNALGVTREADMKLLWQCMAPYLVCVTCLPILGAAHPLSPPSSPPPQTLTEEELKAQVIQKIERTLEEGEEIAQLKNLRSGQEEDDYKPPEPYTFSLTIPDDGNKSISGVTPWVVSAFDMATQDRSISAYPSRKYSGDLKPAAVHSTCTLSYFSRKPAQNILDLTSEYSHNISEFLSKSSVGEGEDREELLTGGWIENHDPDHEISINPVFVLKALRDFVHNLQSNKHRTSGQILGDKREEKKSISRQLLDSDITKFWSQFRNTFPSEREKLWDCLHMGLQRYHSVLQERHRINLEIEQLKIQNSDLRRLLQKYAMPNNMKTTKGGRHTLPPLNVRTSAPTTPAPSQATLSAPTPNRLVLTFNQSSSVKSKI